MTSSMMETLYSLGGVAGDGDVTPLVRRLSESVGDDSIAIHSLLAS